LAPNTGQKNEPINVRLDRLEQWRETIADHAIDEVYKLKGWRSWVIGAASAMAFFAGLIVDRLRDGLHFR
jgi:hypothetical protein